MVCGGGHFDWDSFTDTGFKENKLNQNEDKLSQRMRRSHRGQEEQFRQKPRETGFKSIRLKEACIPSVGLGIVKTEKGMFWICPKPCIHSAWV